MSALLHRCEVHRLNLIPFSPVLLRPCFPFSPVRLLDCSTVCVVASAFGLRDTVTAFSAIPLSPGIAWSRAGAGVRCWCWCAVMVLCCAGAVLCCNRVTVGQGIPYPAASGDPRWRGRGVAGVTVPRQHPHRFYLQNRFQRNHDNPVTLLPDTTATLLPDNPVTPLPDTTASLHPCCSTTLYPHIRCCCLFRGEVQKWITATLYPYSPI